MRIDWTEYPDQCPKCAAGAERPCLTRRGFPTDPHRERARVATAERKLRTLRYRP